MVYLRKCKVFVSYNSQPDYSYQLHSAGSNIKKGYLINYWAIMQISTIGLIRTKIHWSGKKAGPNTDVPSQDLLNRAPGIQGSQENLCIWMIVDV